MKRRVQVSMIVLLVLMVLACGPGSVATPTADLQATMAAGIALTKAAQQDTQPTNPPVDVQATVDAQVQATLAAQQAAAQNAAIEGTNAALAAAQPTQPGLPEQSMPETSGDAAATQQAQSMHDLVQSLKTKANLWSAEGLYHHVGSFDERYSHPREFGWWDTDKQQYGNFIVRADLSWRAPGGADPVKTGCGFIWAYSNDNSWYSTFLDLEGTVHTFRKRGSSDPIEMKGGKYPGGLGSSSGEAEMIIVVEEKLYTVFINGMEVVRFKDPYIGTGRIGMAIHPGGSLEGMHCMMENVGIWELQ